MLLLHQYLLLNDTPHIIRCVCLDGGQQVGKKLMPGKNPKSKGKKMSHGNSHANPEDVRFDETRRKWIWIGGKK